jgi:hypothetical protein
MRRRISVGRNEEGLLKLRQLARCTHAGEIAVPVSSGGNYSVSMGSRYLEAGSFKEFLELSITMEAAPGADDLGFLASLCSLLRELVSRGYVITTMQDGVMTCEVEMSGESLFTELDALVGLVDDEIGMVEARE